MAVFLKQSYFFNNKNKTTGLLRGIMPKYIIERTIPGAGDLTASDLQNISQKSCCVLTEMGPQIQWLESFVTADKVYCVYIAPNEAAVREHAKKGEFPADSIAEIKTIIDPTTGE